MHTFIMLRYLKYTWNAAQRWASLRCAKLLIDSLDDGFQMIIFLPSLSSLYLIVRSLLERWLILQCSSGSVKVTGVLLFGVELYTPNSTEFPTLFIHFISADFALAFQLRGLGKIIVVKWSSISNPLVRCMQCDGMRVNVFGCVEVWMCVSESFLFAQRSTGVRDRNWWGTSVNACLGGRFPHCWTTFQEGGSRWKICWKYSAVLDECASVCLPECDRV